MYFLNKKHSQKIKKIEVLGIWCYNTVGDNMKIINRKDYINKLIALKNKPDIKIITGVRRAGKSVLLNEFSKYILSVEQNANIIRINFNLLSFDELKDYRKLNSYIRDKYISGVNNYVFIDEVQMCPKFELAINDLYEMQEFDIYITGSNAFLLSSDLATLFTGRYFELEVFPFSMLTLPLLSLVSNSKSLFSIGSSQEVSKENIANKTINNLFNLITFYIYSLTIFLKTLFSLEWSLSK